MKREEDPFRTNVTLGKRKRLKEIKTADWTTKAK